MIDSALTDAGLAKVAGEAGERGGVSVSLEAALAATAESDSIDFKREFDPSKDGDWCELLKDLLAMGNSGGGAIVVGVDRAGKSVGVSPGFDKKVDPAAIGDKIRKYTGGNEPRCTVHVQERDGQAVLVIFISSVRVPVAFERAGTYQGPKRPMTAFQGGTFYFRHNTKSEPATTEDLETAIEREVDRRRDEWLGNIQQVMQAPPGANVVIASRGLGLTSDPSAAAVCLSNSPDAAPLAYRSRDETHPHRLKELLGVVNSRLPKGIQATQGEIQNIRRAYDADGNPNWVDLAKHGSTQYSEAFADWLVEHITGDPRFGAKAKAKARRDGK